jgi:tetratricopeptide (TPR) repeat protein
VASAAELIERGIKLYMAGRVVEAREAFQLALDFEPANARARAYLAHLREVAAVSAPAAATESPPPGSAPAVEVAPPPGPAPVAEAVPLPAPEPPPAAARPAGAGDPRARPPAAPPPTAAPPASAAPPRTADPPPEDAPADEYAPSPWDEGPAAPATIQLDSTNEGLDLDAVAEKSDLRPLVPEGARPGAATATPKNDVEVWLAAAKELFSLGDFSGSLELIEKILQVDPDHGEARDYLRQNEATLVSMYESKLGPLTSVPRLAIKPEEVLWLNLDHRAGFLLAQIDGAVDYESLFALSGLPRLDTARILANLISDGVITS